MVIDRTAGEQAHTNAPVGAIIPAPSGLSQTTTPNNKAPGEMF